MMEPYAFFGKGRPQQEEEEEDDDDDAMRPVPDLTRSNKQQQQKQHVANKHPNIIENISHHQWWNDDSVGRQRGSVIKTTIFS